MAPAPPDSGQGPIIPANPPALESLPGGSINRQVFTLALPMLGEQFVNFLVGLVDTYLAGYVAKEATAAVGTGAYVGWFVALAFSLIAVGSIAVVARSFGARDLHTANRALNQAVLIALGMGLAASAAVFAGTPAIAAFLTQTPTAGAMFVTYLRIDALGYTLYSVVLIGGGVIRASGDTRTPMAIMIVVNIVNLFVSAALVFGWFAEPMGVAGIAIGTLIARSLGGVLMTWTLIAGLRGLRLQLSRLRPDPHIIWRMLRVGLPAAADSAVMWAAQVAFIKIIAHTATGDAATANYAAHMIAVRMEAITYLPATAWMTAAATLVGQYLGARQPERAARAGHTAALQGGLLTTVVGIVFFLLAHQIYAAMSGDPQVRAVGSPAFRWLAFVQPLLGTGIIYMGALRGAGDTRWTMLFSLIGGLGLRVPLAYLGGIVLAGGLLGAWSGMIVDIIARFLMGSARFTHGGWKRVRV
jgi:putative MATE family efflux protein